MKLLSAIIINILCWASVSAQLYPGMPAPELKVGAWVKGKPISKFEKGSIYVVEFWATWCGPCKASIPHLTELAAKYKGKVSVIGVSVAEANTENVKPFVDKMGKQMDYNVCIDQQGSATARTGFMIKNWMGAAKVRSIPFSFIVGKTGNIEYMGGPGELEDVIEQILANKWDTKEHARQVMARYQSDSIAEAEQAIIQKKENEAWNIHPVKIALDSALALEKQGRYSEALIQFNAIENMDSKGARWPYPKRGALQNKLRIYNHMNDKINFYTTLDLFLNEVLKDSVNGGPGEINSWMWNKIADPTGANILKEGMIDYDFVIGWMNRAIAQTNGEDPALLDTLAWINYRAGKKEQAVNTEQKALALVTADDPLKVEFEKSLKKFQEK